MSAFAKPGERLSVPEWVPETVLTYLAHVEAGRSIRSLARDAGCHASTVLRLVRRYETRRDDPLIDLALKRLSAATGGKANMTPESGRPGEVSMNKPIEISQIPDDAQLKTVAPRVLRRLNESGACLAIASDMDKAVIARDTPDGQTMRTMVVERVYAEAMALKDWIAATSEGRITRYRITTAGRMALKRFPKGN